MRATINEAASSPGQEAVTLVAHAAKARLIHDQDATITAKMMQNLGPILTAFQPTKDAVLVAVAAQREQRTGSGPARNQVSRTGSSLLLV
jgi:hypothetical protein